MNNSYPRRINTVEPNWEWVDQNPEWMYQFVGIFHSEGTCAIKKHIKGVYNARISLGMRADEHLVMNDIYAKLAGHMRIAKAIGNSNPMYRWELNHIVDVHNLLLRIQQYTVMPCKKLRDVEVVLEFCKWRFSQPYHNPDWSVAAQLFDKLQSIRVFKVAD